MADLALGGLERIVKACLAIKKAVETVQQNKNGCRDVETCMDRVTALLSRLKEDTMGAMMHHPAFTRPLDDLAESMEEALQLVTDCQKKNALRHLLGAGDMAKQLTRVREDIQSKLATVILATSILNLEISVSVTKTLHYLGPHPPLLQPQVAGEVNSYDNNLTVPEMRPGVNSNTTMLATGNVEPYAYSSKFNSSKWESAFFERNKWESAWHLSSEENITQGGHAFVKKQKIVIKMAILSARSRSKAMQLLSEAAGVHSLAITGDSKDMMEVVGEGMDSVCLINRLRKKVCRAVDLLTVEELPARQRFSDPSSGSSSDAQESPPLPSSWPRQTSLKSKGKQTLSVAPQPHNDQEEVRPHVATPARPAADDGPSARGIMAHLRTAAASVKASLPPGAHKWLVPVVPAHAYGMIFVLVFLIFLRIVTSSHF